MLHDRTSLCDVTCLPTRAWYCCWPDVDAVDVTNDNCRPWLLLRSPHHIGVVRLPDASDVHHGADEDDENDDVVVGTSDTLFMQQQQQQPLRLSAVLPQPHRRLTSSCWLAHTHDCADGDVAAPAMVLGDAYSSLSVITHNNNDDGDGDEDDDDDTAAVLSCHRGGVDAAHTRQWRSSCIFVGDAWDVPLSRLSPSALRSCLRTASGNNKDSATAASSSAAALVCNPIVSVMPASCCGAYVVCQRRDELSHTHTRSATAASSGTLLWCASVERATAWPMHLPRQPPPLQWRCTSRVATTPLLCGGGGDGVYASGSADEDVHAVLHRVHVMTATRLTSAHSTAPSAAVAAAAAHTHTAMQVAAVYPRWLTLHNATTGAAHVTLPLTLHNNNSNDGDTSCSHEHGRRWRVTAVLQGCDGAAQAQAAAAATAAGGDDDVYDDADMQSLSQLHAALSPLHAQHYVVVMQSHDTATTTTMRVRDVCRVQCYDARAPGTPLWCVQLPTTTSSSLLHDDVTCRDKDDAASHCVVTQLDASALAVCTTTTSARRFSSASPSHCSHATTTRLHTLRCVTSSSRMAVTAHTLDATPLLPTCATTTSRVAVKAAVRDSGVLHLICCPHHAPA